jgi:hypothetical protein
MRPQKYGAKSVSEQNQGHGQGEGPCDAIGGEGQVDKQVEDLPMSDM